MKEIHGMGLNKLCAIGRIHFYGHSETAIKERKRTVTGEGTSTELQRLEIAFEDIEEELYEGERSALHEALHESARLAVFEGYEASDAVSIASERIFSELSCKGDPYISEMGAQVSKMAVSLVRLLSKEKTKIDDSSAKPIILVCGNIPAKELIVVDKNMIMGIFICGASPFSELAIYAHSLGIPLIISDDGAIHDALEREMAIIDSEKGVLIISPEPETVEHYGVRLGGIALNRGKSGIKSRIICHINDPSNLMERSKLPCISVLLRTGEGEGAEELYLIFSSLLDEIDGAELKIILPVEEIRQKEIVSAAIKASEKGKITLFLPSATDISSVRALKYSLYSELESEVRNIAVGAVIDCGASVMLIDEIGAECAFFAVDSDKLTSSLLFPMRASSNDKLLLDIGYKAFLKAAENLIEAARNKGIRLCFFGMTASGNDICEKLISIGAHEIAISLPYIGGGCLSMEK